VSEVSERSGADLWNLRHLRFMV